MSVNKYMHPRNIYKIPPDFKQLALDFPEFRQYVIQDLNGKVNFDFKNNKALRALSSTLLKKDFNLDVEIPLNKLIPTVPLRLNYILWLEDLLTLCKNSDQITGIDIGTGASCIYPLVGAKKNGWFLLATEVDVESVSCAKQNVERNNLTSLIEIMTVNESVTLKEVVKTANYDFCMCNPPFFGSTQELHPSFKARKPDRPKPKNSFCASINEVVVKGGEIDFITKLINESVTLREQVKIYSTMIGHKSSLPLLKFTLRQANVSSFKETEFCQGNTTRWGLAWTFCPDIDLKKCPDPLKQLMHRNKPKEPLIHKVPLNGNIEENFQTLTGNIVNLFADMKMAVEDISRKKNICKYLVRAFSNTWSHQRKKRREILKNQCELLNSTGSSSSSTDIEIETSVKSPGKREFDECLDGNVLKKLKICDSNIASDFFKFTVTIKLDNIMLVIELDCSTNSNREYLHQILQYIKNHLKIPKDL